MNSDGNTRKLALMIVDEFTYDLHHSIGTPQIDFTRVPSKEIVKLTDHIEKVIIKALGK